MNRRNFITSLGLFTVLPSASTYKRIWKEIAKTEINPQAIIFFNESFESRIFYFLPSFQDFLDGQKEYKVKTLEPSPS